MKKLAGKVAVVTGGSRDIGRAISISLAQEGARVVVNYLNSVSAANETLQAIEAIGGEAVTVQADVSTLEGISELKAKTIEAFGDSIDILVNNAGGLFARKTLQDWLAF